MSAPNARVAIAIVTWNSSPDLADCFAAIGAMAEHEAREFELVVADCASSDDSVARSRALALALPRNVRAEVVALAANLGFAGGMNAALAQIDAPFVLTLNADARPRPDFAARLVARIEAEPRIGAVAGRLVRPAGPRGERRLDACGMRLTATWRHLDRGSGEEDRGQFAVPERVFGATGAASLFRRAALLDAAIDGEVFDPRFHSFREDAELCFRLRERGWEIVYEPAAVAEHRRFNLPERRREMPPEVNFHSLKNRYLLRLYHQTAVNLVKTSMPTLARDLLALLYALAFERSSLGAYGWLWRHRAEIRARRRAIQARRIVPSAAIDRWFFTAALPLSSREGEER